MVRIPGGPFLMGSESFYPEEMPVRTVTVPSFRIDRDPVTVADFARFVAATGHVTLAERPLDPEAYPGADPAALVPGSAVFRPTDGPVPLDSLVWWHYVPGACWRAPEGPGSESAEYDDHPVTHVAYEDALAYAAWAGKALPTEAEWEVAARGGLEGKTYAWGDEEAPGGRRMANTWQGAFPWRSLTPEGARRTSRVGAYPPNGFGLHDMIGNVWEWTVEPGASFSARSSCCAPAADAAAGDPRRIIKGGSHLCSPDYCLRYRPSARQAHAVDTSTSHLGLRCVVRQV